MIKTCKKNYLYSATTYTCMFNTVEFLCHHAWNMLTNALKHAIDNIS